MLVEPQAGDRTEDNLNPVGRLFYAGSALICVPHAIADGGRERPRSATRPGRRRSRAAGAGGLPSVRRAAETPFNRVLEARP